MSAASQAYRPLQGDLYFTSHEGERSISAAGLEQHAPLELGDFQVYRPPQSPLLPIRNLFHRLNDEAHEKKENMAFSPRSLEEARLMPLSEDELEYLDPKNRRGILTQPQLFALLQNSRPWGFAGDLEREPLDVDREHLEGNLCLHKFCCHKQASSGAVRPNQIRFVALSRDAQDPNGYVMTLQQGWFGKVCFGARVGHWNTAHTYVALNHDQLQRLLQPASPSCVIL